MAGGLSRLFGRWRDRPSRHHAYALLTDHGVAYGRIPKAANSMMRARLVRHAGIVGGGSAKVNQDAFWADRNTKGTALLTGRGLCEAWPDAYVFTIVRNPFARLVSTYENKILYAPKGPRLGKGFAKDMAFDAFVEAVAETTDDSADFHIRSQTSLLFGGGDPPMLHVLKLERLQTDWGDLRRGVRAKGFDIGRPPRPRPMPNQPRLAHNPWTPRLVALLNQRYAADFARFYHDAVEPEWTR
ncbi:MAG: sulfotransferase family 2 domain-containing protein [Pseudomonadota bacterium]